jgi:hypothetical protein
MKYVCQQVFVPFVLPYYGCQVNPHPRPYVTLFQFQILRPCGIHSQFSFTVPQQLSVLVCKLSNKSQEKTVHVELMHYIFKHCKSCHSYISSCHCASLTIPVFA